jgi:DNA-directed RNA polymerase alpha subunit
MFIKKIINKTCKEAAELRRALLCSISAYALEDITVIKNTTMINTNTICQLLEQTPIYSCDQDVDATVGFFCSNNSTIMYFPPNSGLDVEDTHTLPLKHDGVISGEFKIRKGTPKDHAKYSTFAACTFKQVGDYIEFYLESQRKSIIEDYENKVSNILKNFGVECF